MLHDLLRYWIRIRGDAPMPRRSAFDPVDIPRLLPNINLFEVVPPDNRLIARVVGTRIVEFYGGDYTGKYLDEIDFGSSRDAVLDHHRSALAAAVPMAFDHDFWNVRGALFAMERLILPLSEDGDRVSHLVAGLAFEEVDRTPD